MTPPGDQMELIFPSDFKFLGAVDAAVQDLAREQSCTQRWINDFSTAMIEACSNAIEHGNKFDKKKIVRVTINLNGNTITALISDQGNGFDYAKHLEDDIAPSDPLSERGRGIIIMKAFTDDVSYVPNADGGLSIKLVKTVVTEETESATESD